MKKNYFVILFLGITTLLISQNSKIDSLQSLLITSSKPKKIEVLNELSKSYRKISLEKTVDFGQQALTLSQITGNKKMAIISKYNIAVGYYYQKKYDDALKMFMQCSLEAENTKFYKGLQDYYFNIGLILKKRQEYEEALAYFQKALQMREKIGDKSKIAIVMHSIGVTHWYMAELKIASEYFLKEIEIFRELNDKKNLAAGLNNLGNIYIKLGNYEKSLNYYLASLRIKEELQDKIEIAIALTGLGNFFWKRENDDSALKYHLQALEIYKTLNEKKYLSTAYNSIGLAYALKEDYGKSLEYYFNGLQITREINDDFNTGIILNNIASVYVNEKKYSEALDYFLKSLKIKKTSENKAGIAETSKNIGSLYLQMKDYQNAFDYLSKGFDVAKQIDDIDILKDYYQSFSDYYTAIGNIDKAFDNYKKYVALEDSIFSLESNKQITEMRTKYETEKKEKEIDILTKNAEIQKLKLRKNKIIIFSFIFGFIVILILAYIIYRAYRREKIEIKKRKIAERKLNNLNQNLEKRVKEEVQIRREQEYKAFEQSRLAALGELAAGIAHEINQPLHSIAFAIDNMSMAIEEDDADKEYLQKKTKDIFSDIDRMKRIIDHIRTFSRKQTGEKKELFNINQSIKNAVNMIQEQYSGHRIHLEMNLAENLPKILGNLYRFEQVVLILLSNGKDAVEEKALNTSVNYEKKLSVRTFQEGKNIFMEFEDNGIGIPDKNLDKIFNPFYTTKKPQHGTGLGLSIAFGIIGEMEGKIEVESEVGIGTKVSIKFRNKPLKE